MIKKEVFGLGYLINPNKIVAILCTILGIFIKYVRVITS